MTIVADESVDFGIILLLRQKGITVLSIAEESFGIKDEEVLAIAVKNKCMLITEDKDFGELTYRLKLEHTDLKVNFWRLVRVFNKTSKFVCFSKLLSVTY
jgi:predicted nuclease of predicted toxin-antitoxin system